MAPLRRKINPRRRRQQRTRAKIMGLSQCPRLSVFRSHRHISAQLIDDAAGVTLASASDFERAKAKKKKRSSRQEQAERIGERLAEKAMAQGLRSARFDRGPYRYRGLVAAVARGARKGGLRF